MRGRPFARRSDVRWWQRAARLTFLLAALAVLATGCDSCAPTQRPPAPLSRHPPAGAFDGFDRDDAGRPIVASAPVDAFALQLVYDENLDDPISRWGQCVDRVSACQFANRGRLGDCVDQIAVCTDSAGGDGCCPKKCIEDYKSARGSMNEDAAIRATFLKGDCIDGVADQLSILDEPDVQP